VAPIAVVGEHISESTYRRADWLLGDWHIRHRQEHNSHGKDDIARSSAIAAIVPILHFVEMLSNDAKLYEQVSAAADRPAGRNASRQP